MQKESFMKKFSRSQMFTLLIMFILVYGFFGIASKGVFFARGNLISILNVVVVVSILTTGATLVMIAGTQDLSSNQVGALAAIVLAALLRQGTPTLLALVIALASGAAVGVLNSFLINDLRFAPFIATLATSQVARGLMMIIAAGQGSPSYIPIKNDFINFIGGGKIFNKTVPFGIVIMLVVMITYGILLKQTKFGKRVYMVGGNPNAAMLCGINPKKMSYVLCVNSGFLSALAGILMAGNLKSATTTSMQNHQFSGMTAAILGGVSFGGGSGGMGGAFIGLLMLNGFTNGLITLNISAYYQLIASGALLMVALTLDYLRTKQAMRKVGVGT